MSARRQRNCFSGRTANHMRVTVIERRFGVKLMDMGDTARRRSRNTCILMGMPNIVGRYAGKSVNVYRHTIPGSDVELMGMLIAGIARV